MTQAPHSIEEQVAQLMIVAKDGVHAVCLNPDARHHLWVHYDNHGTWGIIAPCAAVRGRESQDSPQSHESLLGYTAARVNHGNEPYVQQATGKDRKSPNSGIHTTLASPGAAGVRRQDGPGRES